MTFQSGRDAYGNAVQSAQRYFQDAGRTARKHELRPAALSSPALQSAPRPRQERPPGLQNRSPRGRRFSQYASQRLSVKTPPRFSATLRAPGGAARGRAACGIAQPARTTCRALAPGAVSALKRASRRRNPPRFLRGRKKPGSRAFPRMCARTAS